MPYRKQQFVNGEIYHLVLRAIDNNLIFKNADDYYRGIFSIYEFNNSNAIEILKRRREIQRAKQRKVGGGPSSAQASADPLDERDKLVEILAFCFMPNHIHLLVKQLKDGGITKFMRKVGTGYGGYFNRKYKRKGYVFQDRFSSILIKDDTQLKIVFVYIHTNPAALVEGGWKEKGVNNPGKVIKFLEKYKWSSYSDYLSIENFPSVTERDFLLNLMRGETGCKEAVDSWIKYKSEIRKFTDLAALALERTA
ncbi:MAG: transposase [Candidatus Wildermuthbacteria bacterium]|nr:transposase [Candidatus Wildermuthbacteria bacterium]